MWTRENELMCARAEIYKAIVHRQYIMIEMLSNMERFNRDAA